MAIGGIIIEVIYLFIGAFFAFAGGNLYYLTRRKNIKGDSINEAR